MICVWYVLCYAEKGWIWILFMICLVICLDGPRPNYDEIVKLRSFMLMYLKQLLMKGPGVQEDELQSILNYLSTLHEVRFSPSPLNMIFSLCVVDWMPYDVFGMIIYKFCLFCNRMTIWWTCWSCLWNWWLSIPCPWCHLLIRKAESGN